MFFYQLLKRDFFSSNGIIALSDSFALGGVSVSVQSLNP